MSHYPFGNNEYRKDYIVFAASRLGQLCFDQFFASLIEVGV